MFDRELRSGLVDRDDLPRQLILVGWRSTPGRGVGGQDHERDGEHYGIVVIPNAGHPPDCLNRGL